MKLCPYLGPRVWRLALFMAFFMAVKSQLLAGNQLIVVDSVQNFPFSTVRYQWSFDSDSSGGVHNEFIQISDTAGGDDGPLALQGFDQSVGFFHTASSTQPSSKLRMGPVDVRGMDSITFALHMGAAGLLEHSDFIGIAISINGGEDFYPQLKLRGSKSGTQMDGWSIGSGLHYSKDFRWSSRSSSIYGHVDPKTKDTIDGIGAISITEIPQTASLMIEVELQTSTLGKESYVVDNLTISGRMPAPSGTQLSSDTIYEITSSGAYQCADTLAGLYINVPENDTVRLLGSPWLVGNVTTVSGVVQANFKGRLNDATISGNDILGSFEQSTTITDTGYHFIGHPGYFSTTDTLPHVWVYDPEYGYWDAPQNHYSRSDSSLSMGRLIYLTPAEVPLELTGTIKSGASNLLLGWADTCLDGSTPMGGWNLLANVTGRTLNWNQVVIAHLVDSMDYTMYTWENGQYGSYNPYSGAAGADPFIAPGESFWVRLSNVKAPAAPPTFALSRVSGAYKTAPSKLFKSAVQPDTVSFEWTTTGKNAAVHTATLFIDSAYKPTYMPCCDQLNISGPLSAQVSLLKPNAPLVKSHMPKSSYYPLYLVGDGELRSTGAPGWFFLPPNLYTSSKPLVIRGKGPHKVYWLGADHPDIVQGQTEYSTESILGFPEVPAQVPQDTLNVESSFDLLGRKSQGKQSVELQKVNGKWTKVIKVK